MILATSSSIVWVYPTYLCIFWFVGGLADFAFYSLGALFIGLASILPLRSFFSGNCCLSPVRVSCASLIFIPYELLGFSGLGPGRQALRSFGGAGFLRWLFSLRSCWFLVGHVLLSLLLLVCIFFSIATGPAWFIQLAGALVVLSLAALLIYVGARGGLRVTGRHLLVLHTFLIPLLGFGAWQATSSGFWYLPASLVFIWLVSAVLLRLSRRHFRDDYRGAVEQARAGLLLGPIWWCADWAAAHFYGIPLWNGAQGREPAGSLRFISSGSAPPSLLLQGELPVAVFFSRPELFDPQGILENSFLSMGYSYIPAPLAFKVLVKPGFVFPVIS